MKTRRVIFVLFSLLVGLLMGLMAGLKLSNPGMSLREAAGTIGRVDQYRNIRVTEADIELRNELLADEKMREAYRNYLTYEYTANLKMSEDVDFALRAGRENSKFRVANASALNRLEQYAEFLDNARLRILEAMGVVTDLSDRDRIAIRTVLNNAGNALAQTQLRGNVVFDYLTAVERFFDSHPRSDAPQLAAAHDLLFTNMLMNTIVNDNRPVLEYLLARDLMTDGEEELMAVLDVERLNREAVPDMERMLGIQHLDVERLDFLQFFDVERLNRIVLDLERLQDLAYLSEESLQFFVLDVVQLSSAIRDFSALDASIRIQDMQRLGKVEALGHFGILDTETLGDHILFSDPLLDVIRSTQVLRESDMMMDAGALRGIWPQ